MAIRGKQAQSFRGQIANHRSALSEVVYGMKSGLDCLLISPDSSRESYQSLSAQYSAIEPPVWAQIIAGTLNMFRIEICDPLAEGLTDEQVIDRIWHEKPKLICFVVYGQNPNSGTCNMAGVERLGKAIKREISIPIAIVGPHASALPKETLALEYIDHVIPGNGLQGLARLMECVIPSDRKSILFSSGVGNWTVKYRHLPDYSRYRCHTWHNNFSDDRSPFAAIYTSIGCPFKCGFCMINMVNKTREDQLTAADAAGIRYFDAGMILDELEMLAQKGVRNVRISDEMFFLNKRHYLPILDGLRDRRLGLNLWAYARVDTVKPEYLERFKGAGFNWLCLGIEAGNKTVRREASKGSFEDVDVRQVAREIQNAGINLLSNFIFGLPGDSQESMQETLDLAMEINAEHANFYPCMALPGSPLYADSVKNSVALPETYSGYSFHSYDCQPLPTKHCTAAEVLEFRDRAWHTYVERPEYLNMIERKFGLVSRKNIERQSKIILKRKLLEY